MKPCDSSPCKNRGVCTNNKDSYTCKCAIGFKGDNCEEGMLKITTIKYPPWVVILKGLS